LNPTVPADAQESVSPFVSVIVTIVLIERGLDVRDAARHALADPLLLCGLAAGGGLTCCVWPCSVSKKCRVLSRVLGSEC